MSQVVQHLLVESKDLMDLYLTRYITLLVMAKMLR